jgi:hypothetical protein
MREVLIRPANPYDYTAEELEELAGLIRDADPDLVVSIDGRSERGYGVTPWEVVEVVATVGGAAGALQMTAQGFRAAVAWARRRWVKDRSDHPTEPPRPRSVRLLYGPDGSVLSQISIDLPDGEPLETEHSGQTSDESPDEHA